MNNIVPKITQFIKDNQQDIILFIAVFLIAIISFSVGRIYTTANIENVIEITGNRETSSEGEEAIKQPIQALDLRVVVSKNSNKYHFLWCISANRIKESNKIYFESDKDAENRGYTLAGNCKK